MRIRLALVVLLALLPAACGDDAEETPQAEPPVEAPTQLRGVIIDVDAESLTEVKGFTLRSEGKTYDILLDPAVNLGFAPSHLNEHVLSGDPVVVDLAERDGELYAQAVEDA